MPDTPRPPSPAAHAAPARRTLGRRRAGFTLAEVVLAAAVLAAGVTSAILVMQWGLRHLDLARGKTLAAQILQSEVERLRMMNWDLIVALPAEAEVPLSASFSSDAELAGRFRLLRSVAADPARPDLVRLLTVRVLWSTNDGRARENSLRATYVRQGLNDYLYTLAQP